MREGIRIFVFSFLMNLPYYLLCCIPFFPKLRVRKRTLVTMIVTTTLCVAGYYVLRNHFLPNEKWIEQIALPLFYLAYMVQYIYSFKISFPKLLYIFLVVQAYSNIINFTAKYIDVKLYPDNEYVMAAVPYGCMALSMITITFPFVYRFLKNKIQPSMDELENKSFWMLCITPVLFLIINMGYARIMIGNIQDSGSFFVYITILITGFLTYFVTFRTTLDSTVKARLEADMRNMEHQLKLQARGYMQLTDSIADVKAARHDLRHHLAVISAYVEDGDMDGLKEYLGAYRKNLPEEYEPSLCANYAVDTIVRYYLAQTRRAGAEIDVKIVLPGNAGIPDSELCIVFGNLFENAANSIQRQKKGKKFIYSRCTWEKGKIVLILDNSTDVLESSNPGIGLSSVKAVADRYEGGVRFEQDGDVYKSSVMLLLPQRQDLDSGR